MVREMAQELDPSREASLEGLILFVSDRKNSERFLVQPEFPTAAHRSLPFGTRVRVTDPAWIVS